jgi:signal transduction histidine kinase
MSQTESIPPCTFAATIAYRLRASRDDLTQRWLDRISDRVRLHPNRVFPSDELLDHVPLLIDGVADYLENPANAMTDDVPMIAKAMELGELRYAQGFDEHELLKEYELFGSILYAFLSRTADDIDAQCTRAELLTCAHRLFHAVALIQQATTTQYLSRMKGRIHEREERLRAFNRALTHELRNRVGAAMGAAQMLGELSELDEAERKRLFGVVFRNVESVRGVLDNLAELSRIGTNDTRQQRHVALPAAVSEASRQLREAAQQEGVEVRIKSLPPVEVNAAAVELAVSNLLSNAIKYCDHNNAQRWVEVSAETRRDEDNDLSEVVVKVRDNGIGVPEVERANLFQRFFRAHSSTQPYIEGTGLGLSIVRETIEALGGRAWGEFSPDGSTFAFSLPCRREEDRAAIEACASAEAGLPTPR